MSGKQHHTVTLPHPRDGQINVGRCDCGWSHTYTWGGLHSARQLAQYHIQRVGRAHPIDASTFAAIRYMEGESL